MASFGLRGGFITMDVHTGEILALGSYPTFEPAVFTKPMTQAQVNALYRDPILAPLTDRAIAGLYPTGSTFKPITAIAALESGNLTPGEVIYDPGQLTVGEQAFTERRRSRQRLGQPGLRAGSLFGRLLLHAGAEDVGQRRSSSAGAMLGIGRPSGSTCPGATEGLLPSQHWRNQPLQEGETERPWSAGDNVQLATGQGDLQTNPLQMAIAYAAIAQRRHDRHPARRAPDRRRAPAGCSRNSNPVRSAGMSRSMPIPGSDPRRPARRRAERRRHLLRVFGDFPIEVAGKTGTAQRPPLCRPVLVRSPRSRTRIRVSSPS